MRRRWWHVKERIPITAVLVQGLYKQQSPGMLSRIACDGRGRKTKSGDAGRKKLVGSKLVAFQSNEPDSPKRTRCWEEHSYEGRCCIIMSGVACLEKSQREKTRSKSS